MSHKILWPAPILLTIIAMVIIVSVERVGPREWKPASVKHNIPVNSEFEELWNLTTYIRCKSCLASTESNVYFSGSLENNSPEFLVGLDLHTGQIEWQQMLQSGQTLERIDSQHIYINQPATQKIANSTQLWGTAQLIAYDIESHDEAWKQKFAGSGGVSINRIVEEMLIVEAGSGFYQVDIHTGQQITGPQREILLSNEEGFQYQRVHGVAGILQGIYIETQEVIWTYDLLRFSQFIFEDELILIGNDASGGIGEVTTLNGNTGEELWRYARVISNIATSNGVVYFIQVGEGEWGQNKTLDARMIAADIQTGEVLSTLRFEPSEISSGGGHYEYLVAASDDIVLVYLGDGRQLIALRFLPDE